MTFSTGRFVRTLSTVTFALAILLPARPTAAQSTEPQTPAASAASQEATGPNPGAFTLTGGVDFLNQYMFRGIRQNSTGLAMWPWADLGIAAYSGDGGVKSVGINLGTWNSLHTGDTGTDGPSTKLWYESDFYATLGLGLGGGVSLATTYTAYTSPNNTFSTVKELIFKVAVDDSAYLGKALSSHTSSSRRNWTRRLALARLTAVPKPGPVSSSARRRDTRAPEPAWRCR